MLEPTVVPSPSTAGPVGTAPSRFHLADIPTAIQDHAFARIASQAVEAWTRRTAPFALGTAKHIERECHAVIAALIDVLLGGEVNDNAEEIATQLIGADREPDAVMVAEVIRAFVREADADRPPLPVVRVVGDTVACPRCGVPNKIFQDAHAVEHREVLVERGRLMIADGESGSFKADDAFVCDHCQGLVALPYTPDYELEADLTEAAATD